MGNVKIQKGREYFPAQNVTLCEEPMKRRNDNDITPSLCTTEMHAAREGQDPKWHLWHRPRLFRVLVFFPRAGLCLVKR